MGESQERVGQNELEVTGGPEGSRESLDSWHIVGQASLRIAVGLEVAGFGHCMDLGEEQTAAVRTMAGFGLRSALTLLCLYGTRLVDQ